MILFYLFKKYSLLYLFLLGFLLEFELLLHFKVTCNLINSFVLSHWTIRSFIFIGRNTNSRSKAFGTRTSIRYEQTQCIRTFLTIFCLFLDQIVLFFRLILIWNLFMFVFCFVSGFCFAMSSPPLASLTHKWTHLLTSYRRCLICTPAPTNPVLPSQHINELLHGMCRRPTKQVGSMPILQTCYNVGEFMAAHKNPAHRTITAPMRTLPKEIQE